MPLKHGNNATVVKSNIQQLIQDGYKHKQAVAIALDVARRDEEHNKPQRPQPQPKKAGK